MTPPTFSENSSFILLVDDDKITNLLHSKLFEVCHIKSPIEVVTSGATALDFLTCKGVYAERKSPPQSGLILLDINMPVMNGWEFLEEYKKLDEKQKSKIFIVMLTSSIDPNDKQRADQCQDIKMYLYKPLTRNGLENIIHNYSLYLSGVNNDSTVDTLSNR
jgi:CheY-like chemotaxis protein